MKYNHQKIEKKWQKNWEKMGLHKTKDLPTSSGQEKSKFYVLDMFPYPSGAGLHVGHPKGYIATDIMARMKMMNGFSVLHPMGWDAFGLPAENYAIKNKVHPSVAVEKNIKTFKRQLGLLGFTYDWDREINTTDPEYYKWTQWAFLKMFERGLAYESYEPINWCPECKTGLANEDLENGLCERCGSAIEKKPMRQWVLRITDYADRLLKDLDKLTGWPEPIKEMQKNWIGRSEGALVKFQITIRQLADKSQNSNDENIFEVFTTRPDTLFGATYCVLAPEHSLIENYKLKIENFNEVKKYIEQAKNKSDLERTDLAKEKTGVELKGIKAVNPVNGEELPIFVADYVLSGYGTGAIMAVPAHDERDFEFAKKYNLPVKYVVEPITGEPRGNEEKRKSIVAIVRNPKDGKILSINWGDKLGGNLFIGGGLEGCENPADCAGREIAEETGYKNLKLIAQSEKIHHHYFAFSKNVARNIEATGLLFELAGEERDEQKLEQNEAGKFKVEWLSEKEAGEKVKDPLHHYLYDKFITGKIFSGDGISRESGFISGLPTGEAKQKIIAWLEEKKLGERKVQYKLRDWVFSRQRYWGEPIPLVHCEKCGVVAVSEKDLPIELPKVKNYEPTGTGESPLAAIEKWVNTKCPKCGGKGKRETNTMPQWAGSCWYYLAYIMRGISNFQFPISKYKEGLTHWLPVDLYVGGAEHATRHLIYARFWHKFLFDIGAVSGDEPFARLQNVGLILAEDGRKMSKRWGNVINPDDVVEEFGADSMRLYEMFMGPFDQPCAWNTQGLVGMRRFLEKVWALREKIEDKNKQNDKLITLLHQTIKKVTEDVEAMCYNTAISQMMILVNEMGRLGAVSKEEYSVIIRLLAPFAPHIAEELWAELGNKKSIFLSDWPKYDPELAKDAEISLAIQVNGKVRDVLSVSAEISEEEVKKLVLSSEKIQKWLEGKEPRKIIYVKGKLVSVVV